MGAPAMGTSLLSTVHSHCLPFLFHGERTAPKGNPWQRRYPDKAVPWLGEWEVLHPDKGTSTESCHPDLQEVITKPTQHESLWTCHQ